MIREVAPWSSLCQARTAHTCERHSPLILLTHCVSVLAKFALCLQGGSGVARGGAMAPPKLLVNVFFVNEFMLLRGWNVQEDLGSVPEFAWVSINGGWTAGGLKMYPKCPGIEGMWLICQLENFLLLPPPQWVWSGNWDNGKFLLLPPPPTPLNAVGSRRDDGKCTGWPPQKKNHGYAVAGGGGVGT